MKLHLDSIYRNRWEEFGLADGTVEDSRIKNWREVAWDQVIWITVFMNGHVHTINYQTSGFRAFMNFRWGGSEIVFDKSGNGIRKPIDIWTIGWTDGQKCYLKDIDFQTGKMIKTYTAPLSQFKAHIHPVVKSRILNK